MPKKYSYNERFFENIDTEEKAYWLGFIAADGSIVDKGRVLEISLKASDRNQLVKLVRAINGSSEMIKDRLQKAKDKLYETSRLSICCVQMCNDLARHGVIPRKGSSISFPNLTGELLRHYLRGYFDGDGSISTNGTYRKGNPKYALNIIATENFLEGFTFHMMDYGITRVVLKDKCGMKVWNKVGIQQIKTILHYLYDNCNVYLDRKYQYAMELCRPEPNTTEDSGLSEWN